MDPLLKEGMHTHTHTYTHIHTHTHIYIYIHRWEMVVLVGGRRRRESVWIPY